MSEEGGPIDDDLIEVLEVRKPSRRRSKKNLESLRVESPDITTGIGTKSSSRSKDPVHCPICLTFSTFYLYSLQRHVNKCSENDKRKLRPQQQQSQDTSVDDDEIILDDESDQDSPGPSIIKEDLKSFTSAFSTEVNICDEQEPTQPVQVDPPVNIMTPMDIDNPSKEGEESQNDSQLKIQQQEQVTPPKKIVNRKKKGQKSKGGGTEEDGRPSGSSGSSSSKPPMQLLITSHCTKCPMCEFTTKYHFNIARHLFCVHKEDYKSLVNGTKFVAGIERKDPDTIRRRPSQKPSTPRPRRTTANAKQNLGVVINSSTSGDCSNGIPPVLGQQQSVESSFHDVHSFGNDGLPVLDLYSENMDLNPDLLNMIPEPSSTIQSREWAMYLPNSFNQQQDQPPESSSILRLNYEDQSMSQSQSTVSLGSVPQTVQSLESSFNQNQTLPQGFSSSSLPSSSSFNSQPILRQGAETVGKGKKRKQQTGVLTEEQKEARKKLNREKARERREKGKLMRLQMLTPTNASSETTSTNPEQVQSTNDETPVPLSVSEVNSTSRVAGRSQSLPNGSSLDAEQGKPGKLGKKNRNSAQSTDNRYKKLSLTEDHPATPVVLTAEEKAQQRAERQKRSRQLYYLKKKSLKAAEKAQRNAEQRMEGLVTENVQEELQGNKKSLQGTYDGEALVYDLVPSRIDESHGTRLDPSLIIQEIDDKISQLGDEPDSANLKASLKKEREREYKRIYYQKKNQKTIDKRLQIREALLAEIAQDGHVDRNSLPNSAPTSHTHVDNLIGEKQRVKVKRKLSLGHVGTNDKGWTQKKKIIKNRKRSDSTIGAEKEHQRKKINKSSVSDNLEGDDEFYDAVEDGPKDDDDDEYEDIEESSQESLSQDKSKSKEPASNKIDMNSTKLHKCAVCPFTTPHGFSFLIHKKIHETINVLPEFFLQLLNVNDNMKRLLTEEPDTARPSQFFTQAGFTSSEIDAATKKLDES